MTKILRFPEKPEEKFRSFYSPINLGFLMEAQAKKSFRYGLTVGLGCGASFTLLGFVLAFIFR